jgi:hypothetical protein
MKRESSAGINDDQLKLHTSFENQNTDIRDDEIRIRLCDEKAGNGG